VDKCKYIGIQNCCDVLFYRGYTKTLYTNSFWCFYQFYRLIYLFFIDFFGLNLLGNWLTWMYYSGMQTGPLKLQMWTLRICVCLFLNIVILSGPNCIIKDLPAVLILIIAVQISNRLQWCSYKYNWCFFVDSKVNFLFSF